MIRRRRRASSRGTAVGDEGQTAAEFAGILGVAVVVIVTLVLAAPGFGRTISAGIAAAICRITGGTCTTASMLAEPEEPCKVAEQDTSAELGLTVFSIHLGGNQDVDEVQTADGKYEVTVSNGATVGLKVGEGGDATVDVGHTEDGAGESTDVQVGITGSGGQVWDFDNRSDADKFTSWAETQTAQNDFAAFIPGGAAVKWVWDHTVGYTPPKATGHFYNGGIQASFSVDESVDGGGASADAAASAVIGVNTVDRGPDKGKKTVYFQVSADGEANLGSMLGVGADGSLEGEAIVAVNYDANGKPTSLSLEMAGSAAGSVSGGGANGAEITGDDLAKELSSELESVSAQAATDTGLGVEAQATLDLDDPENLDVAADALHALGVPVLQGSGTADHPSTADAVHALYNRFASGDGAHVSVETYDVSTTKYGGSIGGGDGLEFDAEAGLQVKSEDLKNAQYYVPGTGQWVTWTTCMAGK